MKVCPDCERCYDDLVASCAEHDHTSHFESREGSCEMIAGYRLEVLLESGPKGEVYQARQTECGQSCLITICAVDANRRDAYLRDAELAATLFHPCVTDIYEVGNSEIGEVFVVAEDPEGQTLREHLNDVGVPPLVNGIAIIRQAAEALHAIHQKGLLHGAIRPENIILTTDLDDQPLVRIQHLDFGGVAQQSTVSNKFLIETALDSLRYFAPEQCSGEDSTAQTDVYGLGIVFYEMLAGEPPFDAAKATALIAKHRNQQPPDIRIDNFELRMLVTHALTESLQKRPDARQSTADLFARQLRHIEQLATHVSTPPPIVAVPRMMPKTAPRKVVAPVESLPVEIEREPIIKLQPKPAPRKVFASDDYLPVYIESKPVPVPEPSPVTMTEIKPVLVEPPAEHEAYIPYPQETIAVSALIERTKIEWDLPENDIPSVEDVMEALAREQEEPEVRCMHPEAQEIAVVQAGSEPEPTGWQPYKPVTPPPIVIEEQIVETSFVEPEPEEITIIKAPRRIKIDWEKPMPSMPAFESYEKFSPHRSNNFYPTILGGTSKIAAAEAANPQDSIFASYSAPSESRFPASYRSLMIGSGFLVLMAFFLFGNDSVRSFVQMSSLDDSVGAVSTSEQKTLSPPEQKTAAQLSQKTVIKTLVEPVQDRKDDRRIKPVIIKDSTATSPVKPQPAAVRNSTQTPLVPSTLVITSEKGKVKTRIEPAKNSPGSTRPRIVKEP